MFYNLFINQKIHPSRNFFNGKEQNNPEALVFLWRLISTLFFILFIFLLFMFLFHLFHLLASRDKSFACFLRKFSYCIMACSVRKTPARAVSKKERPFWENYENNNIAYPKCSLDEKIFLFTNCFLFSFWEFK